jgi:DNA-binding PadR family transcriptional regulator
MSIKSALLAILSLGDCHGYQLKHELTSRTGSVLDVNIGQIYSTLSRLERAGLVEQKTQKSSKDGQQLFTITEAGRAEANAWLFQPVMDDRDVRNDLATKLALAVTLPAVDVSQIVKAQRAKDIQKLQALTMAKRGVAPQSPAEVSAVLMNDRAIFNLEAELRWLDHIEKILGETKARGLDTSLDLNTYEAKRGRPAKTNDKKIGETND